MAYLTNIFNTLTISDSRVPDPGAQLFNTRPGYGSVSFYTYKIKTIIITFSVFIREYYDLDLIKKFSWCNSFFATKINNDFDK